MLDLPSTADKQTRYSFGSTSAIITMMALLTGLNATPDAKTTIIRSLLIIGLADNISDTMGIHIYQESEGLKPNAVWVSTLSNFLSRFVIVFLFAGIVWIMPISASVPVLVALGFIILSAVSYLVASKRRMNPVGSIIEHIGIAFFVILASHSAQQFILRNFGGMH